jgi:molybdopterin biosynthesis enzyme
MLVIDNELKMIDEILNDGMIENEKKIMIYHQLKENYLKLKNLNLTRDAKSQDKSFV